MLKETSVSKQWRTAVIRRRVLRRLVWFCTVCRCPIKRTLGLYGFKVNLELRYFVLFTLRLLLVYRHSNRTLFFGNNIKSKMGILNLIRKIYFNQKTLTIFFLKFVYVFINAVIGWNFNILYVYAK